MSQEQSLEIEEVIALFHNNKPLSYKIEEIRNQETDKRWVLYVDYPEGKYVIKLASNGFTTTERVNGWVDLIQEYKSMGYYSPMLLKSRNNLYAEQIIFHEKHCIVWEEEFAKYHFMKDLDKNVYMDSNHRYVFHDEKLECIARIGQKHITGFPGNSGWARFEPFSSDETCDEVTDCISTFDELVRTKAPQFLERWQEIYNLFLRNKEQLEAIYPHLPTSVFQADWGTLNILLDDTGHFKGMIDYNLAGEDVVLNIFFSQIIFGFNPYYKESTAPDELPYLNTESRQSVIQNLLESLKAMRKYYDFTASEAEAAPLLLKYILGIEYRSIEALQNNLNDDNKLTKLFDFMESELRREDIDFRKAMFKNI